MTADEEREQRAIAFVEELKVWIEYTFGISPRIFPYTSREYERQENVQKLLVKYLTGKV